MNQTDLQRSIMAQHARLAATGSAADREELERLQSIYRRSADICAADRGHPLPRVQVAGSVPTSRSSSSNLSVTWPSSLRISEYVMDAMRQCDWDGYEDGGWLSGSAEPRGGEFEIRDQVGRANREDRSRDRLLLNTDQARSLERSLPPGDVIIGDFHTHHSGGAGRPSDGDLRAWETALIDLERSWWVGIILTEDTDPLQGWPAELRARAGAFGGWGIKAHAYLLHRESGAAVHRAIDISSWRW